jgi:hypothetical protein
VLFDIASRNAITVSNALFPNAYTQTALLWRNDSRAVTYSRFRNGVARSSDE